jgi:Mg-chelatase subunit ChlD
MNTAIVKGSLADVMNKENLTLAESFLSCDAILIVDTSASMTRRDAANERTRHDAALDELKRLQLEMPGKLAVVSFSSDVMFCPTGSPFRFNESTDMARALNFVKPADNTGVKFVLISDGEPDSENETLKIAKKFKSTISCVHIGPETDRRGRAFLDRLAEATGGQHIPAQEIGLLAESVERLLLGA